ncbi:hypothetical protein GCM10027020_09490 [Nocardioides salsibiostraticola]
MIGSVKYCVAQFTHRDGPDGEFFDIVPRQTVSAADFERYRDAHRAIINFLHTNLHALVSNDLVFHRVVLADFTEGYARDDGYPQRKELGIQQMALASVLNYSVGVRLYQEHSESRARRNGGSGSGEHVERVFREEYDRCPDLFLMRRIREVAVHSTLDLVRIAFGSRLVKGDPANVVKWSGIYFNVETLLSHDRLNARLKNHLRTLGPEISVVEVMERALSDLTRVDQTILPFVYPRLLDQCQSVLRFRESIRERLGHLSGVVVAEYADTGEPLADATGGYRFTSLEEDHAERYAVSLVAAATYPP